MSYEALNLINQARAQARNEGWKKFICGKTVVSFIILLVVLGLGVIGFRSYQKSQQEKFSTILHQSLINQQIGEPEKAKENLKTIYEAKSAPKGVRSLASIRYAAFLLEEGNKSEAAKIYAEVNDCKSCDEYIRDLAGLLLVKTWMSDETELQKADLNERVSKIEKTNKILRYYILEQKAWLEMKRNELEKSYQTFESIAKNPETAKALKARAEDGLKMVIEKGYTPKVEVKSEEKTDVKSEEKSKEKIEEKTS